MKTLKMLFKSLFLALGFVLFFATQIWAADPPEIYLVVDYMKVTPGMESEYVDAETGVWKKMHTERKKAGQILDWTLVKVLYPRGANEEFDYFTVTAFSSYSKLVDPMEGMEELAEKAFTKEERDQLFAVGETRTIVKTDVFRLRHGTTAPEGAKDAKYGVVNYMKTPSGGGAALGEMESTIWKPVHQHRVDNGDMAGWGLYSREMPFGTDVDYNAVSVDFFHNFEDINAPFFEAAMKKVHPGKDLDEISKKTSAARDIILGIITEIVDGTE